MTKAEIIDYLYTNNVRGDFSIEQMAEDLDRPQGKRIFRIEFVEDTQFTGYRCSNCNYWQGIGVYNYCPNCGAKMKGADDE